jgi:hypothetical protein
MASDNSLYESTRFGSLSPSCIFFVTSIYFPALLTTAVLALSTELSHDERFCGPLSRTFVDRTHWLRSVA